MESELLSPEKHSVCAFRFTIAFKNIKILYYLLISSPVKIERWHVSYRILFFKVLHRYIACYIGLVIGNFR